MELNLLIYCRVPLTPRLPWPPMGCNSTTQLRARVLQTMALLPLENLFVTTIQIKMRPLSTDGALLIFVLLSWVD